jgi:hypothetical protein
VKDLDAHGLTVGVPTGWEARIFRRNAAGETRTAEVSGPAAPLGERTFPVAQISSVALPVDAADYGSDVVATLGPNDVFIVLKEFDPQERTQPLFARRGLPRSLDSEDVDPSGLQRALTGQAGRQIFFQDGDRAFCLYIVLGSYEHRGSLMATINQVLGSIRIDPGPVAP